MSGPLTILLAAGRGTRMKSRTPKVLHTVAGRPMLEYPLEVAAAVSSARVVVVVGHGAMEVRGALASAPVEWLVQEEQRGTAHAVLQAGPFFEGHRGPVLVLSGDVPLLRAETVHRLLETHERSGAALSFLSARVENPTGYGRVLRERDGRVLRIVEERDADAEEKSVREINGGIYCFEAEGLGALLSSIPRNRDKGEYYLTDAVSRLRAAGREVRALEVEAEEVFGINSRVELARAERLMRRRINEEHMGQGVTLLDPEATYIDAAVKIGQDTRLYPNTYLLGHTRIGKDCVVMPGTLIVDSELADSVLVQSGCVLEGARVGRQAVVGPFSHLRPEAVLADEVHVGNFVEVKNATLGHGTKANHLSYIGDATVGKGVNIGAGTITCNYDGARKHRTVIEDEVFVGSDTQLVAPVSIGRGTFVAAGTTVTKNVPAHSLVLSRVPQVVKENWVKKKARIKKTAEE